MQETEKLKRSVGDSHDRTKPPCDLCDPQVVAVCEESGSECKKFRTYVGK